MVVGACTYGMNLTFFPLGGGFGYFANKWLLGLVGMYGMIAVNIIVVMLWVMLCYNTIKALIEQARKRMPARRNFQGDEVGREADKPDSTGIRPASRAALYPGSPRRITRVSSA